MANPAPRRRSTGKRVPAPDRRQHLASVARRAPGAIGNALTSAGQLIVKVPATVHATGVGAHDTTVALQALPDSTLRWLAAGSVGLGAGFHLAGAPRLVTAAGMAPALIIGAAMALRPLGPTASGRPRGGKTREE